MKDKLFIISIPMLPQDNLKELQYTDSGGFVSRKTRFSGIALIEKHIEGNSPIRIIAVVTDDDNQFSKECYRLFEEELSSLSDEYGIPLSIESTVHIQHNESETKQAQFLRDLFECFDRSCYVYMDLTFGSKVTSIELFSSLCYAEVVRGCNIKSVSYGKYAFDGSDKGDLYDVTRLYHTVRFLETAAQMDKNTFINLIDEMLDE